MKKFYSEISIVILMLVSACTAQQESVTSKLTREQAMAVVENALEAFDRGDYAAWSRDWSDDMKAAIKEKDFLGFRDNFMAKYGNYVAVSKLELLPGKNRGYVRWVATCEFAKSQLRFEFGFRPDGDKVTGVFAEEAKQ